MRKWLARTFPTIDGPKIIFGFLAWLVIICCVIGFFEPIVKGEPYHWLSDTLVSG